MALERRTLLLGRKVELERQTRRLAVEIDVAVHALRLHFEPMDPNLQYIDSIDPETIQIDAEMIARKKKVYGMAKAELALVNSELGE